MKRLALLTLLLGTGFSSLPAESIRPVKVLFLVGGIYHDYDQLPRTLTHSLQAKLQGSITIDFKVTKDLGSLRSQELSKYSLLMMDVCEQTSLSPDQKQGFLDAVNSGLSVVALHCTFWSFQDWPEFRKVLGAFVPGHDQPGPFCLETAAPDASILKGVPKTFQLTDEPYIVNDRDPSMKVLVRTCKHLQNRSDPEPQVWATMYGKGRVFAMTFGHDSQAQTDPNYLTLLANGLRWALDKTN